MPGPNRINFLSLICSCVGHAAILGGIAYGLSDFRREQPGMKPSSRPLVVELIPIDRTRDAVDRAGAHGDPKAPAVTSRKGQGPRPRPLPSPPEAVKLAARPEDGIEAAPSPEKAGDRRSAAASDFSDYQRRLYAAVARGSRYPAEAGRLHLAGVTQLAFRIDRAGTVLESWIQESSGSELLDNAALEALARARPLPPIPEGLPSRMDFVIEIDLAVMQQFAVQTAG